MFFIACSYRPVFNYDKLIRCFRFVPVFLWSLHICDGDICSLHSNFFMNYGRFAPSLRSQDASPAATFRHIACWAFRPVTNWGRWRRRTEKASGREDDVFSVHSSSPSSAIYSGQNVLVPIKLLPNKKLVILSQLVLISILNKQTSSYK